MRPCLDDCSLIEHHDQVGLAHGAQAMGNHKRSPFLERTRKIVLDCPLTLGIPAGGGYNVSITAAPKQRSGNGDPLFLSTREI